LPRTGNDERSLLLAGVAFVIAGTALVAAQRRTRRSASRS
jgi:LPXTG-motif cell wall-anchored protein